jgi:hypothetical protein
MLETIREFAMEQLDATAEAPAIRQRHAGYFLALAEEATPQLYGPQQGAWLNRLEREHENVRQALRWLRGRGERGDVGAVAQGLRFGAALWRFWCLRGYLAEGREWVAVFLALDGSVSAPADAEAWTRFAELAASAPGCIAVERSTLGAPPRWAAPAISPTSTATLRPPRRSSPARWRCGVRWATRRTPRRR